MPKRHWRDSIEDLLALEYGGEMINLDNRKEETEVGRQVRFERASGLLLSSQVVTKKKRSPDPREITYTEAELNRHFKKEEPLDLFRHHGPADYGSNTTSTADLKSRDDVINNDDSKEFPAANSTTNWPSPSSIISQITISKRGVSRASGKKAIKTVIQNRCLDGRTQRIEIVQNPSKVLKEVERARASITDHEGWDY
ncbi:hypothetical protein MMC28_001859 [Mycoblastus sanguinarius]|nr:hypothetical protein [Mycoblastus sanguinarius]